MMIDEIDRRLRSLIRDVPDFPKPGIVFKDVTPLLADAAALAMSVEIMANPFRGTGVDLVVGAESRGFIFGTAVSRAISAGFVPVRRPGKLPGNVRSVEYDLEYGSSQLEIHADAIQTGTRCLIVDDLLATGGTMAACCDLVRQGGGDIVGVAVLIELEFLGGRAKLDGIDPIYAVIRY